MSIAKALLLVAIALALAGCHVEVKFKDQPRPIERPVQPTQSSTNHTGIQHFQGYLATVTNATTHTP